MTTTKHEAKYSETVRLIARWSKRLTEAEATICKAVPELRRLQRLADRQHKAIRDLKRAAKRKPAPPEPGLNDSLDRIGSAA